MAKEYEIIVNRILRLNLQNEIPITQDRPIEEAIINFLDMISWKDIEKLASKSDKRFKKILLKYPGY